MSETLIQTEGLTRDFGTVRAGGQVEEIRRGKASLEEVFVALMQEENKEA